MCIGYCLAIKHLLSHPTDADRRQKAFEICQEYCKKQPVVSQWLDECKVLLSKFEAAQQKRLKCYYNAQANMGFLKHGFILAFLFLLRTDLSDKELFDESMWQTVALGGDTDTNCAIVGGLVGAYLGLKLIPSEKVEKVMSCTPKRGRTAEKHAAMIPSITAQALISKLLTICPNQLTIIQ